MYSDVIVITGVSVITPYYTGYEGLLSSSEEELLPEIEDEGEGSSFKKILITRVKNYINSFKLGKMSKSAILSIFCAKQAVKCSGLELGDMKESGIILGSAFSTLDMSIDYYKNAIISKGENVRPNKFANSVSCAPSGEVSAELGLTGSSWMFSEGILSSMEAILMGCNVLSQLPVPHILTGGVEVYFEGKEKFYSSSCINKDCCNESTVNEGAAVLLIERKSNAIHRKAKIIAEVEPVDSDSVLLKLKENSFRNETLVISNSNSIGSDRLQPDIVLEQYEGVSGAVGVSIACAIIEKKQYPPYLKGAEIKTELKDFTQVLVYIEDLGSRILSILIKGNKE